jgi:putative acetyltransferase
MIRIQKETPDQPDVVELLAQADARSASLYPLESRYGLDLAGLLSQNVRFYVARIGDRAVGCGGYAVSTDRSAELKRIFVLPETRGKGIGKTIVTALEQAATVEQVCVLQLETGVKSDEAIRLYRRLGYVERGPFGFYGPDPLSVFMEKTLAAN